MDDMTIAREEIFGPVMAVLILRMKQMSSRAQTILSLDCPQVCSQMIFHVRIA